MLPAGREGGGDSFEMRVLIAAGRHAPAIDVQKLSKDVVDQQSVAKDDCSMHLCIPTRQMEEGKPLIFECLN